MKFALRADIARRSWPPRGGWIYHENATGWRAPYPTSDNFDTTVKRIQQHRAANRGYGLPTDTEAVEEALMQQVAERILRDAPEAANAWIVPLDEEAKKKSPSPRLSSPGVPRAALPAPQGLLDRAMSRIRGIARGAATLADWVGDGTTPVAPITANRRASACADCPMNVPAESWSDAITGAIADAIHAQTIVKNALSLSTDTEDKLGVCDACGCHLRLKVWVPLQTIRSRMDADGIDKLHAACWIRNEANVRSASGSQRKAASKVITVQRRAAFGDVLLASILCTKLREVGVDSRLITEPVIQSAIFDHPDTLEVVTDGDSDVQLDKTYEGNLERSRKDIGLLFLEAAEFQLRRFDIKLADLVNRVPNLHVSEAEKWAAMRELQELPRPWVLVVDGSASWPNRSWSKRQIALLPSLMPQSSLIWSKPPAWVPTPAGYAHLSIRNFRHLMAVSSLVDLVITPDTGPIHVAAAFNRPIIAIEQCNPTELRLTNLTDWTAVAPNLDCVRCNEFICPKDKDRPPCQEVLAVQVAMAARAKLEAYSNEKVTAIIPVLNLSDRLARCIEAIRGQVDEVIVVLDGMGRVDSRIHALGVRVIQSTGDRIGYGKTMMRAARQASHRFLLMLNDDCYLDQGSVTKMAAVMSPGVGVVGCLLRYPNGLIQHGGQYRPKGVLGFGHIDHNKKVPSITEPTDMEAVTFAAVLVRREALYAVRGFDEVYDCYSEDTDFCLKLITAGWRVVYQPHATGIHDESLSTAPMKEALLKSGWDKFSQKWRSYLTSVSPFHY